MRADAPGVCAELERPMAARSGGGQQWGVARVETLTVLCTDLVGSTSRRVKAGEEAAERMRVHHDRLVRAAVVANGGKIAKHTGDGVMATFAGASEAVAAAVAVQQSIDADNRRSDQPPARLRIGISVGYR